jgi:hypothetical protein
MYDFLTFKTFISDKVLIFFYYVFAIGIPVVLIYYKNKLFEIKIFKKIFPFLKEYSYDKLKDKQKKYLIIIFSICFILCEIFLRMFFEFLIAYIQIRNALN